MKGNIGIGCREWKGTHIGIERQASASGSTDTIPNPTTGAEWSVEEHDGRVCLLDCVRTA